MKPGDKVEWVGAAGVLAAEYRGRLGSDVCIVHEGMQWTVPASAVRPMAAVPAVANPIRVGSAVAVRGGGSGVVEDVQGLFFIVRVDGRASHFHRSEVAAA